MPRSLHMAMLLRKVHHRRIIMCPITCAMWRHVLEAACRMYGAGSMCVQARPAPVIDDWMGDGIA